MAIVYSNMIYLGKLTPVDTDEGNWTAETPEAILGRYDARDMQVLRVAETDTNHDGAISDDEAGGADTMSYTLGAAQTTARPDASMNYAARVTEADGTVHILDVAVIQMPNGDTFVTDLGNAGTLDSLDIRTLDLTAVNGTNYSGHRLGYSTDNTTLCIAHGTLIAAADGPRPIEGLRPGDAILTADHGIRPLCWIARIASDAAAVAIAPGALGTGMPDRLLMVSPQHRMLVRSAIARRMLGGEEVLVPARRLVGLPGIAEVPKGMAPALYHLGFERHEIICAAGAWTESFLPGPVAMAALDPLARRHYLATCGPAPLPVPARPVPSGAVQKRLIARHLKNGRPLVAPAAPAAVLA